MLLNLGLASCDTEAGKSTPVPQRLSTPSAQLSRHDREALIANVQKVSLGMSANEVLKILGQPKYDDVVGPKKDTKDNEGDFRRVFRYVLLEYGGGGNTYDEVISVAFDSRGEGARSIALVNVPEFRNDLFSCSTTGAVRTCVLSAK
jgi:hypothetical protein